MTKEELSATVSKNLSYAKEVYEKNNNLMVTFIVRTSKGKENSEVVALLGNENAVENRRKIIFELGIRAGIEKFRGDTDSINAVFLLSEAWFNQQEKDKNEKDMLLPSKDPNKKEALISAGLSKEGDSVFKIFEIKKTMDVDIGRIMVTFEPIEGMDVDDTKEESSRHPLLRSFWVGVGLVETILKSPPDNVKEAIRELPLEESFAILTEQLEIAINNQIK